MAEDFKAQLGAIAKRLRVKQTRLARGVARALATEMQVGGRYSPGTPIKTGFHRSHWDASIGSLPQMGSVGGKDAPDPEGAAARVEAAIENLDIGETLFIANDGPAIRRLEFDAWSPQAPGGFVRPAAEAIQQITADVAAELAAERGA